MVLFDLLVWLHEGFMVVQMLDRGPSTQVVLFDLIVGVTYIQIRVDTLDGNSTDHTNTSKKASY